MKKELILIVLLLLTMNGCLYSQNFLGYYTYNTHYDVPDPMCNLKINPDSTYVISCGDPKENSWDNTDTRIISGRWKEIDGHVLELTSDNYLTPVKPSFVIRSQNLVSSDSIYFKFILPLNMYDVLSSDYYVELTLDSCVITSFKTSFALCKRDYYSSFAHLDSVHFDFHIYKKHAYGYRTRRISCDRDNFLQNTLIAKRTIDLSLYNGFTVDYLVQCNSFFTSFDSDHELAYITKSNTLDYQGFVFKKYESSLNNTQNDSVDFKDKRDIDGWIGRYNNSRDTTQSFQINTNGTFVIINGINDTISTGIYHKKHDDYFEIINNKDSIPAFIEREVKNYRPNKYPFSEKIISEKKASPDSLYFKIEYPKNYSVDLSQMRFAFELQLPLAHPFIINQYGNVPGLEEYYSQKNIDNLIPFQNPIKVIRVNDSVNLPYWRDSLERRCAPTNVIRVVRIPESVDLAAWKDSLLQQERLSRLKFVFQDSLVVIPLEKCAEIASKGYFNFVVYSYLSIAFDSYEGIETSRRIAESIYDRKYVGTRRPNEFGLNPSRGNYYTLLFAVQNNKDSRVDNFPVKADDSFYIRPNGDLYFQGSTWKKQ